MGVVERDITFTGQRVELDGRVFTDCVFQQVRLAYEGRDLVVLWNCSFPDLNSLEVELGNSPGKLIWDLGIAHRFGDRALAESVARYIEGSALTLPDAARQFSTLPHLIPSLREITAAIPQATTSALRFIRGERQHVIREPVRLVCRKPLCRRVSIVPSMLPPGASRSVSQSNAMTCPGCGALAQIEDHWTDDSGRVFREFADRILRQPDLPRAAIEQLQATARNVGNRTAEQAASAIEAIDERLAPIADEVRKSIDRRQFLGRMTMLGIVAGAVLLGGAAAVDLATATRTAWSNVAATPTAAHPTMQARTPTLDETVAALGQQLEAACRAMVDAPEISAVELREMTDACRLEARDRQRLATERAAAANGYARQFWDVLRKPEVVANALVSALLAPIVALLFTAISARLEGDKKP